MRNDHKELLFKYFNDNKNKNSLLKIFNQDAFDFFINHINENINKFNKNNELKEILKYYKDFLFESKSEEIKELENAIRNEEVQNNCKQYLKDLKEAQKMNDRYLIIKYIFDEKKKDNQKSENEFKKIVKEWENFEKFISERKIKKMRKQDKSILFNYFINDNNKEILLKIFKKDDIDYFVKEYMIVNNLNQKKMILI